jgi:RNA ligase (TIGR02306 family)
MEILKMRKLVTIRRIDEIRPIEGADVIEVVEIGGWDSIVKKEYGLKAGGLCVYFEIDSWLPIENRYEFLRQSSYKKVGIQEGFRLKTIKLRGQVSQGLAQPISLFPEIEADIKLISEYKFTWDELYEKDYTSILGVIKYEVEIPEEMENIASGNFPTFIEKTGENRCQNQVAKIFLKNKDLRYEVSMKMDGASFTAFYNNGEDGVASMKWVLEPGTSNPFVRLYEDSLLKENLRLLGRNLAVQGEIMQLGGSYGGTRENLKAPTLFIFNIYDIDKSAYISPTERISVIEELFKFGINKNIVKAVPILHNDKTLTELGITDIKELIKFAEGPSLNHPVREGLVFKSMDGKYSFKVISNAYLLKQKD